MEGVELRMSNGNGVNMEDILKEKVWS